VLPNICDEFSENSVHGLHDLHDLPGIFSETLRIRSWTHGDLRDTDMCGGAMVPWCHQVHAAPYGRFHCGDPWVDEDGREWLTLEICHVLSIQQRSAAFSFFGTSKYHETHTPQIIESDRMLRR